MPSVFEEVVRVQRHDTRLNMGVSNNAIVVEVSRGQTASKSYVGCLMMCSANLHLKNLPIGGNLQLVQQAKWYFEVEDKVSFAVCSVTPDENSMLFALLLTFGDLG